MAGNLGGIVQLDAAQANACGLFGEAAATIVVTVARDRQRALGDLGERHAVPLRPLGAVGRAGVPLQITGRNGLQIGLTLAQMQAAYEGAIPRAMGMK